MEAPFKLKDDCPEEVRVYWTAICAAADKRDAEVARLSAIKTNAWYMLPREERLPVIEESAQVHVTYSKEVAAAFDTLEKTAKDHAVMFLLAECRDYWADAEMALVRLPLTYEEAYALADGEGWCEVGDGFLDAASDLGLLHGKDPFDGPTRELLRYLRDDCNLEDFQLVNVKAHLKAIKAAGQGTEAKTDEPFFS